jgi:hypothetical protein
MPLLVSPIDGSPMRQVVRFGIEIDVCPTSGGVWLDRGELEKLMALIRDESIREHNASIAYRRGSDEDRRADYDSDGRPRPRSRLLDVFDFV